MTDIKKAIDYLQEMIKRFKEGDKSISVHDNQTNLATLQHYQRVKNDQR